MARGGKRKERYEARVARAKQPLPPPLPPETRTVGQLVAETVRFYRFHFFQALPLGISVAILTQLSVGFGRADRVTEVAPEGLDGSDRLLLARSVNSVRVLESPDSLVGSGVLTTAIIGGLVLTMSYIAACVLVSGVRPDMKRYVTAYVCGFFAFLPTPFFASLLVLPGVAWLAFVGMVVPVAVIEGLGPRDAFARAFKLARADYVHALGGLATLVIAYFLTRLMLFFLLQDAGESTERTAAFLADLVLAPILFIGSALLYYDQRARDEHGVPRRRRRGKTNVRGAREADGPGRRDAALES